MICCRYEKPSGTIAYFPPKNPGSVSEPPMPSVAPDALPSLLTWSWMTAGTSASASV